MTQPSFSVLIPAYNAAGTIAEAVESALGQTVRPLEIVVIDDGSTDDIDRALAPYMREIALVRKENGGGASAFNAGLRAASGDFVAELDADDAYEPGRIEALGELGAQRPDLDILATDVYLEVEGEVVGRFSTGTPFATDHQRVSIFDRCFMLLPAIRRERLLEIGGQDEGMRLAYDWDCYLRLILAGARAGLVDVPLYRYRLAATSLTGDRPAALRARVTMLEKAMTNPDLRAEEREPLQRAIAENTKRAMLAEAEAALRRGDPDARRRSLAAVTARGFGVRTRAKALLAAAAPRWAGRRLDAAEERKGTSRLLRTPIR